MSALQRGSRTRSKPDTQTQDNSEQAYITRATSIPLPHSLELLATDLPSAEICPPPQNRSKSLPRDTQNMVDAIAAQKPLDSLVADVATTLGLLREPSTDASSSLSELDDREEPNLGPYDHQTDDDEDSEAETERLESTPRKPRPDPVGLYTPSRLANEIPFNDENIDPNSPSMRGVVQISDAHDDQTPSSPLSEDPDATLTELADTAMSSPRKRKRSSDEDSPGDDMDIEEPARKRIESHQTEMSPAPVEVVDVKEHEETPQPEESIENGEDTAMIDEPPVPVKALRGKKAKGKGKKGRGKATDHSKTNGAIVEEATAEPEDIAEHEADDEENGSPAEQVLHKRSAFDKTSSMEETFDSFRRRFLDEQLARSEQELDMVRNNPKSHPEFLAMIRCIDERRDEAISKEDYLLQYKEHDLRQRFVAERQIIQSQFAQTVRELREKAIDRCYKAMYQLQRDRRRWGADEANYAIMFNPKKSQQILQQRAYNTEVSLLSGMAKYIGFPAAPEIKPIKDIEVEEDLRKMGISAT